MLEKKLYQKHVAICMLTDKKSKIKMNDKLITHIEHIYARLRI